MTTWTLLATAAALCVALPSAVAACETPISLTTTQVREGLAMLRDAEADDFDRYLAYQDLSCSDDPVIVGFAREAALGSGIVPLATAVFHERLYGLASLVLRPDPTVELTREQQAWVVDNPIVQLDIYAARPEDSCMALTHWRDCRADGNIGVDGTRLAIATSANGTLELGEDGRLTGMWYPGDGLAIPVEALF